MRRINYFGKFYEVSDDVNFITTDRDGQIWEWVNRPIESNEFWYVEEGFGSSVAQRDDLIISWRDSLMHVLPKKEKIQCTVFHCVEKSGLMKWQIKPKKITVEIVVKFEVDESDIGKYIAIDENGKPYKYYERPYGSECDFYAPSYDEIKVSNWKETVTKIK